MKQEKVNLLFNRGFKVVRKSVWDSKTPRQTIVTKQQEYKQPEKLNWSEKLFLKIPTYN